MSPPVVPLYLHSMVQLLCHKVKDDLVCDCKVTVCRVKQKLDLLHCNSEIVFNVNKIRNSFICFNWPRLEEVSLVCSVIVLIQIEKFQYCV